MIPPDALSRVDELLLALRPRKGRQLRIVVNVYKHSDGTVCVEADVEGEKFRHIVRFPLDTPQSVA